MKRIPQVNKKNSQKSNSSDPNLNINRALVPTLSNMITNFNSFPNNKKPLAT